MDKSSRQVLSFPRAVSAFSCLFSADCPFLNHLQRCPMTSPEHKECYQISKVAAVWWPWPCLRLMLSVSSLYHAVFGFLLLYMNITVRKLPRNRMQFSSLIHKCWLNSLCSNTLGCSQTCTHATTNFIACVIGMSGKENSELCLIFTVDFTLSFSMKTSLSSLYFTLF